MAAISSTRDSAMMISGISSNVPRPSAKAAPGYAMAKRGHRSILHVLLYATSIAMTIYVVLDLEQPRRGVIRLTETDRILESLRKSMD